MLSRGPRYDQGMGMENPVGSSSRAGEPAFRSLALEAIPEPDYADVIVVPCRQTATSDPRVWAETVFSRSAMPRWVLALMALRQQLVGLVGIPKAPADVFAVSRVAGEEALITAVDRHLDFSCGVAFDAGSHLLRVTTAVRLKGWRGRLYFVPVRVLHPLVLRAMMLRAARVLART